MNFLITRGSDESWVHATQKDIDESALEWQLLLFNIGWLSLQGRLHVGENPGQLGLSLQTTRIEEKHRSFLTLTDPLRGTHSRSLSQFPQRPVGWNIFHKITKITTMTKAVTATLIPSEPSTYGKIYNASPLGGERGQMYLFGQIKKEGMG